MHDAKRGGGGGGKDSATMTLIFFEIVWMCENRTIQNKLTTRSVPDPPVRAGDEKHTSSAARWVWVRD